MFLFAKAGAGEYADDPSSRAAVQPLGCGDVLVLKGGSSGQVRAADQAEFAFWAFSLCVEHLVPIFLADEFSLAQPLIDSLKDARFYPAAQPATIGWHQLIRDVQSNFDLEHRSQLLRAAGAILAGEFRKLRPQLSRYERSHERVNHQFERMSVEEILDLSVEELAARFGCSQRHLNRLFNDHFGLSVGALRMEMRLSKALSLLRNPNSKIIEVAEQCGFHHMGLFNDCFKRRFGVSPGQWRKRVDGDSVGAEAVDAAAPSCRLREFGLCPMSDISGKQHKITPTSRRVTGAASGSTAAMLLPVKPLGGQTDSATAAS